MTSPPGNLPTNSNKVDILLNDKKTKVACAFGVQFMFRDDPSHDELDDIIDVDPLVRAYIDKSYLPVSNQEIATYELEYLT